MNCLGCLALLLTFSIARPGLASVALLEGGSLEVQGDFRYRMERDWDSRQSNGKFREDRQRSRMRARLGGLWRPVSAMSLLVSGRSGDPDSQQSPHLSLEAPGPAVGAAFLLDKAHVQWKGEQAWLSLGRQGLPFWRQNELLFDDDLSPEGLAGGAKLDLGGSPITFNAAAVALPLGAYAFRDYDSRPLLLGLQALYQPPLEGLGLTLALAGHWVPERDSVANPTTLDQPYLIFSADAQLKFKELWQSPLLAADFFYNAAEVKGFNKDQAAGAVASFSLGDTKEAGRWMLGYWAAYIQKYAVIPYYAQDDWLRWGSATQTRASNFLGQEIRAGIGLGKQADIVFRYFLAEGIAKESASSAWAESGRRFRVDTNLKF